MEKETAEGFSVAGSATVLCHDSYKACKASLLSPPSEPHTHASTEAPYIDTLVHSFLSS